MACFHPLKAYQTALGDIVFADVGNARREVTLPCGQCVGCRLERSRQWAVRCMHEASMHERNAFVTLTYNDENIPEDCSLRYRDFQLFAKRARKLIGPFRYYMCGEYGERFRRPHYHACLFGLSFEDAVFWRQSSAGFPLYRSAFLERLWPHGHSEIGEVTFESAGYVARYCMKKVTGDKAEAHYQVVDGITGEIHQVVPEFTRMSLKPGIGANWYEKYKGEVFPLDRVNVRGVDCKPPRYYFNRLKKDKKDLRSDDIEVMRAEKALRMAEDNTPERLKVREIVTSAKVSQLQRNLE